ASASTADSRRRASPSAGKVLRPKIGPALTVSRASKRACSRGTSAATNSPPNGHFAITSPSSTRRSSPPARRRARWPLSSTGLGRGQDQLAQERAAQVLPPAGRGGRRGLAAEQGQAELQRLEVAAEALRAVEIGHARAAEPVEDAGEPVVGAGLGGDVAHQDAEAVAAQVARLELVPVAAEVEQADALTLQPVEAVRGRGGDGNPLPRDGVPVLEASHPDLAGSDFQAARDLPAEVVGPHAAFLDPEVEEVTGAGGL